MATTDSRLQPATLSSTAVTVCRIHVSGAWATPVGIERWAIDDAVLSPLGQMHVYESE